MKKKLTLRDKAIEAIREAVNEAIEGHLRAGRRVPVWENGKVVYLTSPRKTRKAGKKAR
jgi:hypothetical protein